ncbi:hypothetical protein Tco_1213207 [Tanacetum coccineum]
MMLKKLSERQFADSSQCKCSEILIIDTISGYETSSRIVSDEEIEKKKLEAHYGFMAKIQEVLPAESSSIDTPLEQRSLLHDNIVPKPDLALELGKSISLTEAEEEAVAREVHATHARIVSESEPEPTQRRQSGIAFRDSFIVSKKRSSDSSKKLKGIQTLTPAEQEAADIMKALKESKKMSKRQPGTGGSNEGTSNILGVPDESTVISRASSEGTGSKPRVPDEEKLILEWEADVDSEHFDRDDNAGDDNEETKPDPEEIYNFFICSFTDTSVIDLSSPKPVSPPCQESFITSRAVQFLKWSSHGSCANQFRTYAFFDDSWIHQFRTRAKLSFSNTICSTIQERLRSFGSPSSTTIDQDEQSTSTSPTNQEIQSQVTHQGVEE